MRLNQNILLVSFTLEKLDLTYPLVQVQTSKTTISNRHT
jgi:hypothetical protein